MKQQLDKIFEHKLIDHSKTVPPFAWDRIEQELDKKNRSVAWYSIAASIAAFTIAGGVYYLSHQEIKTVAATTIIEKPTTVNAVELPRANQHISEKVKASTEGSHPSAPMHAASGTATTRTKHSSTVEPAIENELASSTDPTPSSDPDVAVHDSATLLLNTPAQLAYKAPAKEESVTIILTADQTKEYLITKNITTEATSQEKKSSTFKKLLKKAADLKVNQDPFGELRQKKNEILALNFRSEKRGQK